MAKAVLNSVMKTPKGGLFTITLDGEAVSEFSKFINKFNDDIEVCEDLQMIIRILQRMVTASGFLERFFRPEGKMRDNVCALPIETSKLRLYCLRLSDEFLIAGNGARKSVRRYEDDPELNGYVLTLQQLDEAIKLAVRKGKVTIEETIIDNKEIEL